MTIPSKTYSQYDTELESITCKNCSEVNSLPKDRKPDPSEICAVCGGSLHTKGIVETGVVEMDSVKLGGGKKYLHLAISSACPIPNSPHKAGSPTCACCEYFGGGTCRTTFCSFSQIPIDTRNISTPPDTRLKGGLNLCPECKAIEGTSHYSSCSKFVFQQTTEWIDMSDVEPGAFKKTFEERDKIIKAFKIPPMKLGKIESIEPVGDKSISVGCKIDKDEDSAGGFLMREDFEKQLLDEITYDPKAILAHDADLESMVKKEFSSALRKKIDKAMIQFEYETLYGTGKGEPVGIMQGLEPVEPEDIHRCHICEAPLGSYHSPHCSKSNNRELKTETTELINGRWVTRKE